MNESVKSDYMSEAEFMDYVERSLDTKRHANESIDDLLNQAVFKSVAEANNISIPDIKVKIKATAMQAKSPLDQRIQSAKEMKRHVDKDNTVSKTLPDKQR